MKKQIIAIFVCVFCCLIATNGLFAKTIQNPFTKKRQYITGFTDTGTIDFTLSGNDITAIVSPDLVIDSLVITNSEPPSTASAVGTQGQVTWDASYIYVCIATNTWKRTEITTWAVAVFNLVLSDGTSKILLDDGTSALIGR